MGSIDLFHALENLPNIGDGILVTDFIPSLHDAWCPFEGKFWTEIGLESGVIAINIVCFILSLLFGQRPPKGDEVL